MAVPFRIRRAEWVAGALLVLTTVTLIVGFLFVAHARGTFASHHYYTVTMSDGHGITPGATVEMLGIEIGRVEQVEITEDNRVRVSLGVNADHAVRIRADSVVRVKMSLGLSTMLGGVALVVTPGSPDAAPLATNAELDVVEPNKITDLLPSVAGDKMLADVEAIIANTRALTDDLTQPDAAVRSLLVDVALLVASLRRGEGTVGKLLSDDAELYNKFIDTLVRVEGSLKKADNLVARGGKLAKKSDAMLDSSNELLAKTSGVVGEVGDVFRKMDPVMDDASKAMGSLDEAVVAFGETTRELSAVLSKMDRVVDDLDEITRATKKVFPIRRHLDDKNRTPLVDGPTR
ncbi:MAG: MCE family protein [Nannocystaceae bacterium]|nr:MCE family protein [Nannocystaceae bacterium]